MRLLSVFCVCAIWTANALAFPWEFSKEEDPFTDEVYAQAAQTSKSNRVTMLFACSPARLNSLILSFGGEIFLKDPVLLAPQVDVRVDKNKIRTFWMHRNPVEKIDYISAAQIEEKNVAWILKELLTAKDHLAMRVEKQVFLFSVKGSTAALEQLINTCELQPPPKEE